MKTLWLSLFWTLTFVWGGYSVGQTFDIATLSDQNNQKVSLAKAQKIMVAFDKASYYDIDQFLATKPNFLQTHNIAFINDISAVPSTILKLFIQPAMKKKSYPILLLRDIEASKKLNFTEGKITIYWLNKGKISKIDTIDSTQIGDYFK
ncbi:MAG: hypothetical protein KU38_05980 [Sulfurovum sp. FS08-3]|nr:MAG: hypothetical protein KU38_05980 [Sulfurovum sp. FS08-3]